MMTYSRAIITILLATGSAFAQSLSVGIKGGVPLTNGLSDFTLTSPGALTHTFSDSKKYIIGPSVELHIPLGFSVEADALYRPVNFSSSIMVNNILGQPSTANVSSWEFPILAKYRFASPVVKPLLEAGASFRTTGSQLSWFSNRGLTLGGGIEVKLGRVRFGPELRYTRWGSDAEPNRGVLFNPPSQKNQAELLLGISF
jgi:hypothetical protein